jgi:hypothetical protein
MTERDNIFDNCRKHVESFETPCVARIITENGQAKAIYTYYDNREGQERLLFCGFERDGSLASRQVLGIRNQSGGEKYYLVSWGQRLQNGERQVIERKPEGFFLSHQLRVKMIEALRKEISYSDLEGGYVPVSDRDLKRIMVGWGYAS